MSCQLQSLGDFLGEPVTQVVPGSFLSRPADSFIEEKGPVLSSLSDWRSGIVSRIAAVSQRFQPAKRQSVELERLRAPLQSGPEIFKVNPTGQQGDNFSSGGETASSEPSGAQCMCFDLTDSDDETGDCTPRTDGQCESTRRHSIEAAFDNVRFLAP